VSALELESDRLVGALLCVLGGVGLTVADFLPWITAVEYGQSLNRSGFQLGAGTALTFCGPLCLVVGIFAIVIGIARLISKSTPSYLFHLATLSAMAVGVVLVSRYRALENLVQLIHGQIVLASVAVGVGFWMCCVGAFVPLLGEFVHWAITSNQEFNIRRVSRPSSGETLSGRAQC
jgi:hypothetical protein